MIEGCKDGLEKCAAIFLQLLLAELLRTCVEPGVHPGVVLGEQFEVGIHILKPANAIMSYQQIYQDV